MPTHIYLQISGKSTSKVNSKTEEVDRIDLNQYNKGVLGELPRHRSQGQPKTQAHWFGPDKLVWKWGLDLIVELN